MYTCVWMSYHPRQEEQRRARLSTGPVMQAGNGELPVSGLAGIWSFQVALKHSWPLSLLLSFVLLS